MANTAENRPAGAVRTPAKLPTPRSFARTGSVGQRTLKMIGARCSTCQDGKNIAPDWWKDCTHDKHVTATPIETKQPKYRDEVIDGRPTGRKILDGVDTIVEWQLIPNWKEVAVSPRINQGRGYHRNRYKGSIMPEELVQLYPDAWPGATGVVCQFRGCFVQDNLKEYPNVGVFHSRIEAQLVWYDKEGKTLEYNNQSDADSQGKRLSMLEAAPIGAGG